MQLPIKNPAVVITYKLYNPLKRRGAKLKKVLKSKSVLSLLILLTFFMTNVVSPLNVKADTLETPEQAIT